MNVFCKRARWEVSGFATGQACVPLNSASGVKAAIDDSYADGHGWSGSPGQGLPSLALGYLHMEVPTGGMLNPDPQPLSETFPLLRFPISV